MSRANVPYDRVEMSRHSLARVAACLALTIGVVLAATPARAQTPADVEREARAIEDLLVAPCCFRQQVSQHQSEAADQVKRDIRVRLAAGQTRGEIIDAYVHEYGPRILAEPPAAGTGRFVYVLPPAVLLLSAGLLIAALRRSTRRAAAGAAPGVPNGVLDPPDSTDATRRLDDALRDMD